MAATNTTTTRAAAELSREVPAPTWGDEFGRLWKKHYRKADPLVAELAAVGVVTTPTTLSRIGALESVPTEPSRRIVAAVTLVLLDVHPEQFGIDLDELPLGVYANLFGAPDDPSGLEVSPRACNGKTLPPRARRAKPVSVAA